jgi:hypothetical protein
MRFKVLWHPVARDMLADAWMRSNSEIREQLNEASNQVDRILSEDPLSEGESRPRGRRIVFVPPLGVAYRVDQPANTVYILRIWPIGQRKR